MSDHPNLPPQRTESPLIPFIVPQKTRRHTHSPLAQFALVESNTESVHVKNPSSRMEIIRPDAHALTTGASLTPLANHYVTIGTRYLDVKTNLLSTFMSAWAVETFLMELRSAVSLRRQQPVTPLIAEHWAQDLRSTHLDVKYKWIPSYIHHSAHVGIPHISCSFVPLNKESTESLSHIFFEIVRNELNKGHYIGPFSCEELEDKIGPFQSSHLSLVPKAGKTGKY